MTEEQDGIIVIYDGDCPFCSQYVKLTQLRKSVGSVELLDAREPHPTVARVIAQGFDLDDGMVAIYRGQTYHGHQCLNLIAGLTTTSGLFNRLTGVLFRNQRAAQVLYPWLRGGRNLTLRALGRAKIAQNSGSN